MKTMSVPEAGKAYFDLSRNSAYAAAAAGQIPTIRIGRKLRVPIIRLEQMLAGDGGVKSSLRSGDIEAGQQ